MIWYVEMVINFLREYLPRGERYELNDIIMNRDEVVGYIFGSLIEGNRKYSVYRLFVPGEGYFEVILDGCELSICKLYYAGENNKYKKVELYGTTFKCQ
jgi:hypothetical protein